MANVRHLNNAPITEALVDIRVKLQPNFKPETFRELKDRIGHRFPNIEERKLFSSQFGVKDGKIQPPSSKDHGVQGYFFRTKTGEKVAQFRIDGFTFSRLRPYTNWHEVFSEAKDLWTLYREMALPEDITRLAVRYINHINIPLPVGVDDLPEYFTAPTIAPSEWGAMTGFISKVIVQDREMDITTNIVQALEKSTKPDKHITVVFDIDSYKLGAFSSDNDEMWDVFQNLHDVKNQIFFTGITEKTARLFE